MLHSALRWAACTAAAFALLGPAAAQTAGTSSSPQDGTAASPSGTAATLPPGSPLATSDPSRDCAPTAAGAATLPVTQDPMFRSGMSQCTAETDRDRRADCVRDLWARSGGSAACM